MPTVGFSMTESAAPMARDPNAPAARPDRYRTYVLLATFNVVIVVFSLLFSHQLMGLFTDSVAAHADWVARGNTYARLAALAAEANAPGNDIFSSRDPDREAERLAAAERAFAAHAATLRRELEANVPEPLRAPFTQRLDVVSRAMGEMTAHATVLLADYRRGDFNAAGARMAAMDRAYQRLDRHIERLRSDVKLQQQALLDGQLAQARRLRNIEILLGVLVLLMVGATVAYGLRLARQATQRAHERTRDLSRLQQAQQSLAAAHAELEERVQQRTLELQASEARTRAIIAHAHDAYVGLDADGVVTDWNPSAEAMFGWQTHEAVGQPLHALIIPERHREQHLQGIHHFHASGEGPLLGRVVQLTGVHRAGHELPVELIVSAIPGGDRHVFSAFLRDITERQRAQQELDRFFHLSLDMLCIASPEGYFTRLNPAWEATLGYTLDELMTRPFLEFVHPEDRAATAAVMQELLEGVETRDFENRYRCKDGTWKWLVWRAAPTSDRSTIYGAAHDITQRREAEAELQAHAAHLAEAQRIGRLGTWEWDIASDRVYWSEQMFRVFGIRPAEFTPTVAGFMQLVHPEDRERVQSIVEGSLASCQAVNFEHRTLLPDGSVRHISARNKVVVDAAGAPAKLVGTAQDVTERSLAELALRDSEERFRLVSQATHDVIWDWDLAKGLITYNRGYGQDFTPAEGAAGPHMTRPLENVHPDDVGRVQSSLNACLAGSADTWLEEYRVRLSDGSYAHVLDRALVQRDASGVATRVVGSMLDISAEKLRSEELRQARDAAEAASRAKSDFLANMSHEIRTPMNGALGTIGLLLDSELTPTQRELAKLARASGETLMTLINDILDFSKIEAGKLSLEPIAFDLLRTAEDILDMMAPQAASKDLDLILRFAPEVPRHLVGDPGRIRQVLTNLLGNALKFTAQGQVLLDIAAEEQDEAGVALRVKVEDTGIGIAPEQLGQIFDKFTQADASTTRHHGGTGLGLAISAQLVDLMGGEIGVTSTPGVGSSFWFRIRLPRQADAPVPPPPPGDLAGVRVLVVDDNAVNRLVLNEQILAWRMRGGSCASGPEALDALHAAHASGDPYRIAILDYQMPGMDGEMLGRAIKADPELRDTVLVMLTSLGQRGDVSRLQALGFAAYLLKPARQSELLAALGGAWAAHLHGDGRAPLVTRHSLQETGAVRRHEQASAGFAARVLVVEDHPTNRLVASMMLHNLGCEVDLAGNGLEALAMIDAGRYDVVFMDCEMPGMDGYEATAAIRARADDKARTPIVAVTAQALHGDRNRCLDAGMDDYIGKPVQAEAFAAAMRRWAPDTQAPGNGARTGDARSAESNAGPVTGGEALDADVVARLQALAGTHRPGLLAQVFASFQADCHERIATLLSAAAQHDAETLQRTAHALRGACANVGAQGLAGLARQLETLAATGVVTDAEPLVRALEAEFDRVRLAIFELDTGTPEHRARSPTHEDPDRR